jgi:teichuronic acid exporter
MSTLPAETPGGVTPLATPPTAAPEEQPPTDTRSMDRSFLSSVAWTGAVKWTAQLLTWVTTFAVARLLTPEDYGLVTMAAVFIGLIMLISEAGLSATVVTLRHLSIGQIAQLNTLAAAIGVTTTLIGISAALPLSWFYSSAALPPIVMALSLGLLLNGFRIVPAATLQRDLQFKTLALIEGLQSVAQAGVTVLLAWRGYGAWSLVAGSLAGHIVALMGILALRREGFALPRRTGLESALTFARHQITGGIAWYVYTTVDLVIAGRFLGAAGAGVYTIAWTLARTLPEKIAALVLRVTPAFFSALQNDPVTLRRYVLRSTEYLAMAILPALIGLAIVMDDLVLLLGTQWSAAVLPARLLAMFAAYESLLQVLSRALTATRRTRFLMYDGIALAVIMPVTLLVGAKWGVTGLAATWLVVHPWTRVPLVATACSTLQMSFRQYLLAFWPAFSGTLCMAFVVMAAKPFLTDTLLVPRLIILIGVGGIIYTGVMLTLHRPRLAAAYALVRNRSSAARRGARVSDSPTERIH